MDFTQIQQAWQQQASQPRKIENQMIIDVVRASQQLSHRVKVRDFSELVTAVGLAGAFGWMGWQAPVTWPWMVATTIILGVAVVFARERWRAAGQQEAHADVRRAR